jgi:hypothetical protein
MEIICRWVLLIHTVTIGNKTVSSQEEEDETGGFVQEDLFSSYIQD